MELFLVTRVQKKTNELFSNQKFFCRELVQRMLEEKEELRQKEVQFKEHCRQELAKLQKELQYVNIYRILP